MKFNDEGLIPVIAQDVATGAVLMMAWANEASLQQTKETGFMTYYSRSRQALWTKGETSGNRQRVVRILEDCDQDTLLALVEQTGPACHTGSETCWGPASGGLLELDQLAAARKENPQGRYTDSLLANLSFAAEKIEEEAAEVGAVLRGEDNEDTLEHEAADLLYHLSMGVASGASMADVLRELRKRS